jgi:hypothetical protein
MAQHDYNIANQGFPAFRTDLNNALSAIQTTNSGTSRPTGAVAGQLWLDTTSATTPTLKYYDGADDISLATIDHSANTVNWLDSTVSVTGLTTTATGTVLTLSDSANTSTVNLIIDNDKEIRFREATANGTNYISLSAPASLSADVTYTLPVAPTANNQALISSTAGAMSFTPYSLPASDGTANQILKTDGSGVLSFATPSGGGFSGATTTSSAVDITLTNASTQVQSVEMTASDKSVILPDATTLTTKGFPIFVIVNTGLFTFSVKNNSGYILATIAPTISVEFTLIDNTTSDGIFANDSIAFNLVSLPFVSVEATTGLSTSYFAAEWEVGVSMEKIDTSSFFVSYHKGTSNRDVYGRVISFSGTTITVNSETLLYNGSSTASVGASVCLTSSTTGILLVARASNCVAVPFSLSGSTITVGTTSATFSIASTTNIPFAKPIKVTSTLIAFGERSATNTFKLRTIQYNSGSAPTIGTISSTSITMANDEVAPTISRISDTQLFMAYGRVGGTDARIITISGTSAPVYNTANTTSTQETALLDYGHFINQIDSTNFIVWGYLGSVKYTVSGTTVTHVSDRNFAFYNNTAINFYNMVNAPFNGGDYVVTNVYTTQGYHLLKKDGNHMAVKTPAILFDKSVLQSGLTTASKIVALDTNTLAVVTNNGGSGSTLFTTIIKYVGA